MILEDEGATLAEVRNNFERMAKLGRAAELSRALVVALDQENAEANRRAWRNITRPVDTDQMDEQTSAPGVILCQPGDDTALGDLLAWPRQ